MRTMLYNILAIYRRELQSYFFSPFFYAIAAVFWLLAGLFFVAVLLGPEGILAQSMFQDQLGNTQPVDVPKEFLNIYMNLLGSLSLFLLPMLSMGLYAEERKRGTLELLSTSPITNWMVAVGKLLGAVTAFTTMTLPVLGLGAIAFSASTPPANFTLLFLSYAGLLLMAAGVLSLGMFLSSLTDSTILAAVLTFALMLMLWITDLIASNIGGPAGELVGQLSLIKHYSNFVQGLVDSSALILFASYILLGLFLTAQSIEALRFQRS